MSALTPFDDELLSAYLDNQLAPEERARVEERLAADPQARQLLDELRAVSQSMKELPAAAPGMDLRESVLRRAERAMLLATPPVSGERASARGATELVHKLPFGRSLRPWAWAGAALAAGLLLMVFYGEPERERDLPLAVAKRADVARDDGRPAPELRALKGPDEDAADRTSLRPLASAPPAAATGPGGAAGGAATTATESAPSADEAPGDGLLVVHVNVTPEALRTRAIDAVFTRHQIEVDKPPAGETISAEPQNVDIVLVEAAPAQIRASLAEMNADRANYVSIAVDDELAPAQLSRATDLMDDSFKQYNRGMVHPQQKVQLAPDNNLYYPTARGRIEIQRGQLELSESDKMGIARRAVANAGLEPETLGRTARSLPQTAAQESGQRKRRDDSLLQAESAASTSPMPVGDSYGGATYELSRKAVQKLAAKADMLQVLFVLTAAEPSAAPPAASEKASED